MNIDDGTLLSKGAAAISARRPYPNKRYSVVCRKQGNKAIDGLLIETDEGKMQIKVTTRWSVGENFIATHLVHYELVDDDFGAATEHMGLWHATHLASTHWPDRFPEWARGLSSCEVEPKMEVVPGVKKQCEDIRDEQLGGNLSTFLGRAEIKIN